MRLSSGHLRAAEFNGRLPVPSLRILFLSHLAGNPVGQHVLIVARPFADIRDLVRSLFSGILVGNGLDKFAYERPPVYRAAFMVGKT